MEKRYKKNGKSDRKQKWQRIWWLLDEGGEKNGQQKESMVSSSLAAATAGSLVYDTQSSSTYSLRNNSVHNRNQYGESFIQDPLNVTQQDMTECDNLESDVKKELQVTTTNTF